MKPVVYAAVGCGVLFLLLAAGMLFMTWALFWADADDYLPVQARVVAVEPGCKVATFHPNARSESGRGPHWVSAFQPCEAARAEAERRPPGGETRAFPASRITYAYVSPVDGRSHQGLFDIELWHENGEHATIRQGTYNFFSRRRRDGEPKPDPAVLDPDDPRPGATFGAEAHKMRAEVSRWRRGQ